VRFKVQAVRWTGRGQERVATAAQVVAYIDARTVIARLNLLFPGAWHAQTDALPLEMRLTRRTADGALTAIRVTEQGEVKADDTLYYRCRLQIADATFEDVGAGDDPKAAYSDAIKRAAVRAGIGESLYAMDSPWLRVGIADGQLRVSRAGKPYLDERTSRWLERMYEAWLTRAGSIFGEPLPHAPAAALPGVGDTPPDEPPTPAGGTGATASRNGDGHLAAVAPPAIPEIQEPYDGPSPAEPAPRGPAGANVSGVLRETIATAHAAGISAKTLNRLAVLLAARGPDTVIKLEDLDDTLAAELVRRIRQARAAGWTNDTLADMVEQALRSEHHAGAAARRDAFGAHLDRLAADALIEPSGPQAA
jgi:Rad52/22 family double-strand break repair protein